MSTLYLFFLLFLFTLASAMNIALGYATALLLRGDFDALGLQNRLAPLAGARLSWLKLPAFPSFGGAKSSVQDPADAAPASNEAAALPDGPAPLEGASLAALKLSEIMATFCQSVYEQDLLLREFLENSGDADRARQLAEGAPKFLERHLKRFNQTVAKFDAISHNAPDWLAGKEAIRTALDSLLADANQARDEFLSTLDSSTNLGDSLAICLRGNIERALALRGRLERGLEKILRVDPTLTRLPPELLEEKGKALLDRAALGARLASSFANGASYCAAALDLNAFRAFNEEHGYAVGALLLDSIDKLLAERLKAGEWCFRLDGARWFLFLTTSDPAAAASRIDQLRQEIAAARFEWAKKEYRVDMRGALLLAHPSDAFERLETSLRDALTFAKQQNQPLVQAEGGEIRPCETNDLGLPPVTITL